MSPLILHLDAGHDTNGNPRRVYIVIDPETGGVIEAIDEGYRGWSAYVSKYPDTRYIGKVPTTAAYRRELLKESRARG